MDISHIGESIVILSVSYDTTEQCVAAVRGLYNRLLTAGVPRQLSVRCGLDTIAIEYEEGFDISRFLEKLSGWEPMQTRQKNRTNPLQVPICYEQNFGRDLARIAEKTGMSPDQIMDLNNATLYEVWMIGFMPGFPYMGEVPPQLQIPRKSTPEALVPAGSVALAEEYIGIYPYDSPGGWHILGRTPLRLVDYSKQKPWLFDYGMQVQFVPISAKDFERLQQ